MPENELAQEVPVEQEQPPQPPTPPPVEGLTTEPPKVETEGHIDQPPEVKALQAEIERLEKIRKEKEEQAIKWRKEARESRAEFFKHRGEEPKPPSGPSPEELTIGKEPQQTDFDDYQKYLDAKIDFEVKKAKINWDRDQERKQSEKAYQTKMQTLHERMDEGYKKYSDFEDVALNPTVPISPMIVEILSESENPADVAYYLGHNRAEAIKISRMTPIAAAREIAKIEVEIAKAVEQQPPGARKPSNISNAPPPIKPIGSGKSFEKDLEKMNQKEYEEEMARRTGRRF